MADYAEQAARLCKADLVTEMVGEFPELQGVMGGYYARAEGLPDEVANAIRDHYKPVGQGDEVPTAPVTVAVSLADKLDSLVEFFAIEERPTGSKDPFALRRASISVIGLVVENSIRLPLSSLFEAMLALRVIRILAHAYEIDENIESFMNMVGPHTDFRQGFAKMGAALRAARDDIGTGVKLAVSDEAFHLLEKSVHTAQSARSVNAGLLDFFADRLKVQQREAGVRHDLIDAVFAAKNEDGAGEDDLVRLLARVHALQAFVGTPDGVNLLAGYKRAANILKKEGYEPPTAHVERSRDTSAQRVSTADKRSAVHPEPAEGLDMSGGGAESPQENDLSYTPEPAEKALIEALDAAEPRVRDAVAAEDFAGAMGALASLRSPIDAFFDAVTVNDADPAKRAARLALLARLRSAVHQVADFSKIEG